MIHLGAMLRLVSPLFLVALAAADPCTITVPDDLPCRQFAVDYNTAACAQDSTASVAAYQAYAQCLGGATASTSSPTSSHSPTPFTPSAYPSLLPSPVPYCTSWEPTDVSQDCYTKWKAFQAIWCRGYARIEATNWPPFLLDLSMEYATCDKTGVQRSPSPTQSALPFVGFGPLLDAPPTKDTNPIDYYLVVFLPGSVILAISSVFMMWFYCLKRTHTPTSSSEPKVVLSTATPVSTETSNLWNLHWISPLTGLTGKGTVGFTEVNCKSAATDLNEDYPSLIHRCVPFAMPTDWCALRVSPGAPCATEAQAYANAQCVLDQPVPSRPVSHFENLGATRAAYKQCEARMRKSVILRIPALLVLPLCIFLCILCCQRRRRL